MIAPLLHQRKTLVTLLVAAALFMENLDGTIIATALPAMASDFRATPEGLAIGMTAYLLTLAVLIPASGWVADRFGARRVFALSIIVFTASSVLCGLSGGVLTFTISRILQGGAGALMVPVGRLVVLRGTDRRDLLQAIAMLTWPALTAPILGPPIGGLITQVLSWRWIFFINVPIGAVEFPFALMLIVDGPQEARRPFDVIGFILNGLSLACLLVALDLFGRPGGDWRQASAVLVASLALGSAAVVHAQRAPHPLVALDAFGDRTFRVTMTAGSLSRVTISTLPFLLPILFQVGLGMNPFASGLLVLWYGVSNLGIKPFTSRILRRFGFRDVLVANTIVNAAAIAGCALIGPGTPLVGTACLLLLAGAARSMQFTALNTLAFAEVPPDRTAPANTLFNMAFQLGIGMGIAVGAILLRFIEVALPFPSGGGAAPFRLAFLLVALTSLSAVWGYLSLDVDAGAAVSGRARRALPT